MASGAVRHKTRDSSFALHSHNNTAWNLMGIYMYVLATHRIIIHAWSIYEYLNSVIKNLQRSQVYRMSFFILH